MVCDENASKWNAPKWNRAKVGHVKLGHVKLARAKLNAPNWHVIHPGHLPNWPGVSIEVGLCQHGESPDARQTTVYS